MHEFKWKIFRIEWQIYNEIQERLSSRDSLFYFFSCHFSFEKKKGGDSKNDVKEPVTFLNWTKFWEARMKEEKNNPFACTQTHTNAHIHAFTYGHALQNEYCWKFCTNSSFVQKHAREGSWSGDQRNTYYLMFQRCCVYLIDVFRSNEWHKHQPTHSFMSHFILLCTIFTVRVCSFVRSFVCAKKAVREWRKAERGLMMSFANTFWRTTAIKFTVHRCIASRFVVSRSVRVLTF